MATVSQQIIAANKKFAEAEKKARAEVADLKKAYDQAVGLKGLPQSLKDATQQLADSRKELESLLETADEMLKIASHCAKEYDMVQRKAFDSNKYLDDLRVDKKKMDVALKAAPKDKDVIKESTLINKALERAERDDEGLQQMAKSLDETASEPLRFFDAINKGTFASMAEDYGRQSKQLQESLTAFSKSNFKSSWK